METSENVNSFLNQSVFKDLSQIASSINQATYLIGGVVRDLLLNKTSKDIDIVTEGSGIKLAEKAAEYWKIDPPVVFKNFGTAMLKKDQWEIEFVGARKESYQRNSRKPIVENGTLQEDQERRDFTINALSISLNKLDFGQLYDPFNGINDLKNQIIRTPLNPEVTFSDDPLRMLRAIRFAAQLHFTLHPEVQAAIINMGFRLEIISPERISDELNKILLTQKPSVGFKLLHELKILPHFLPELSALQGVEEVGSQKHKDNFYHTIQVVDNLAQKSDNLWLRWAALLHDIGKAQTKKFIPGTGWTFHNHEFVGSKMVSKIFRRLKLPLDHKMEFVKKMVLLSSRPTAITKKATDSAVRRLLFDAGEDIEDLMLLCESDMTTQNTKKIQKFLAHYQWVREKLKTIEEKDKLRNFQHPISGEIIMNTFELKPSRQIGIIKEAIKEAILEGEIQNNYQSAFTYMLQKGNELGLILKHK